MATPTILYEKHLSAGAKMMACGPWLMPREYTSIIEEHEAARECAALFDTCHMGEIGFAGPGAVPTLERVFTGRVADLAPGRARYGFLTTEAGTVVDDGMLFALPEDHAPPDFMLCVNAGDIAGDLAWIREHALPDTVIEDLSTVTGKLDLQGPASGRILAACAGRAIELPRFGFGFFSVAGQTAMVSRSGFTGEDGYEIFTTAFTTPALWDALLAAGRDMGILPAGLGARDTLRTEACLPLYGHELSREITPLEAGFDWAVSFDKDFIGSDALRRERDAGSRRASMPFRVTGRVPARAGYPVFAGERPIGTVTSGAYLPSLRGGGGMCLIEAAHARESESITIGIRGRREEAILVSRPLFKRRPA